MKECKTYLFEDDGSIPNNPELPLLVYHNVLKGSQLKPTKCKQLLESNGWWNAWVNGIFSYHHFHSTTHEVLVVIQGSARVKMGGEKGKEISIYKGDIMVIPAGVGHCLISSSNDFRVVGAYPDGMNYDLCTGEAGERSQVLENINNVPLPDKDPVTGKKFPLFNYWTD